MVEHINAGAMSLEGDVFPFFANIWSCLSRDKWFCSYSVLVYALLCLSQLYEDKRDGHIFPISWSINLLESCIVLSSNALRMHESVSIVNKVLNVVQTNEHGEAAFAVLYGWHIWNKLLERPFCLWLPFVEVFDSFPLLHCNFVLVFLGIC